MIAPGRFGGNLFAVVCANESPHAAVYQRHRLGHVGVRLQGTLDLPQFDANAVELHLIVDAAKDFQFAVRAPAAQVA
jgi:hypothetical protein